MLFRIYLFERYEREALMPEAAISPLSTWESFYVIVGSSAAVLVGLMFVVITISADSPSRGSGATIAAFGTPTVVHFSVAFFISLVMNAPWQALWHVSLLIGLCGGGGILYLLLILRRTVRQNEYQPVFEDWLWHIILPFISYITFTIVAFFLPVFPLPALFAVAGATILFLFIGIHNAWDTVTYLIARDNQREKAS